MTDKPLLTKQDLADRWSYKGVRGIEKMVQEGRIPVVRLGSQRGIRFRLSDVEAYEASRVDRGNTRRSA